MSPLFIILIFVCGLLPIMFAKRKNCASKSPAGLGVVIVTVVLTVLMFGMIKILASRPWAVAERPNFSLRQAPTAIPSIPSAPKVQLPQLPPMPQASRPRLSQRTPPTTATTQVSQRWVDDWQGFVKDSQSWQRWVKGESTVWATEWDARREAEENAAAQILPMVKAQYGRNSAEQDAWLYRNILQSFARGDLPMRFHTVKTTKPYGDVWQAYVLVEASPDLVQSNLVDRFAALARLQRQTWKNQLISLGAIFAVIVLLYLFLNMATKGYFVWRLRAAAVMVVIVAMLVALAWI